jgi:glycosyltransferase family protein
MKTTITKFKKNKIIQLILHLIRIVYFFSYEVQISKNDFEISTPLETAQKLVQSRNSIARFGDGEFNIIFKKKGIGFQPYSESLRHDLMSVLKKHGTDDIKLGLPHGFKSTQNDVFEVKTFWWAYIGNHHKSINQFMRLTHANVFLDASFTRVITEIRDAYEIQQVIDQTKKIWARKKVLIIEGSGTKFGVGNDLLKSASSVHRIVSPAVNAYSKIEDIRESIDEFLKKQDNLEEMVLLIALGPTATVLAGDFGSVVQTIDIGHFDLQYEYLKKGSHKRVAIINKYDNELANGNNYMNSSDDKYESEIVKIIE